jgi:hypothetical protein
VATIQELIAASLAANPNASRGGYEGVGAGWNPAAGVGNSLTVRGQTGYTPDYGSLLASDPQFLQAQTDVRGQQGAAAAARKAATAKILAQLGIAPDFNSALAGLGLNQSYLGQDFGGVEQGLARQMTEQGLSTTAQLNKQHETMTNSLVDMLAARGSLRSGGLGSGLSVENQRDKQAQFDALQAALNQIGQVQGGYNDVVQQGATVLGTAGDAAVQRQIQLHPAVGGGSIQAVYDESTGLYKSADGAFFNADGSATHPGAANAAPVHPANVAPPTGAALGAPGVPGAPVVPAAGAAPPVPKVNVSGLDPSSANFGQTAVGIAKQFLPPQPQSLHAQMAAGGPTPDAISAMLAGAGVPAVHHPAAPAANPVPVPAPAMSAGAAGRAGIGTGGALNPTAWSNSVTRRLNF